MGTGVFQHVQASGSNRSFRVLQGEAFNMPQEAVRVVRQYIRGPLNPHRWTGAPGHHDGRNAMLVPA